MPRRARGPHLRFRRDKGVWYIYESIGGGRESGHSTGTGERSTAEAILAEALVNRRSEDPARPLRPRERLIADCLTAYTDDKENAVADPARLAHASAALLSFTDWRVVADITEQRCQAYARSRRHADGRPIGAGTIRRELGALAAAIGNDVAHRRLTEGVKVWLPPKPRSKDRWLTRKEVAELLRGARNTAKDGLSGRLAYRRRWHVALFILLALYSAQRKTAIADLRWPQVKWSLGVIDFNPPGRPQTAKRRPVVPIPRRLLTFLRYAWQRRLSDTGYVLHFGGKPVRDVKKALRRAATVAGLAEVTPHVLRHTAASWMAQAGTPLEEVARYLGNTLRVTESTYAHHTPAHLRRAAAALDSYRDSPGPAPASPGTATVRLRGRNPTRGAHDGSEKSRKSAGHR